jgi:sRNA-binding carbon storage regulator CsrA
MVHRHEVYEEIQAENKRAALKRQIDVGALERALREAQPQVKSEL